MNPHNAPASQINSTSPVDCHLSEDQFTDCLLGTEPSPETAAHLAHCAACQEELAAFDASVAGFNSASLAWSEARPVQSLLPANYSRAQKPFLNAASWALAVCTLLVVGASTVLHRQEVERSASVAFAGASQEDSEAEVAQDNKLLQEVDQALHHNVSSPVQEYGLGSETSPRTRSHGETRIQ
jgi:anti-sigma factor RsiW